MKNFNFFIIISSCIVVWAFLAVFLNYKDKDTYYWNVTLGGMKIKAEVALSPKDQEKGLSGRNGLKEDEGMLFVFNDPGKYDFWMKDMKFPIDIIWISEDKKIIDITKNILPESYPAVFKPASSARYVLEVNAGFSDTSEIKIGDYAEFEF